MVLESLKLCKAKRKIYFCAMRLNFLVLIFLFISIGCFSQGTNNPFEIQSRLDSIYESDPSEENSAINIFDVIREDDPLIPETFDLGEEDTETESSIIPTVGEETADEQVLEVEEDNENVNPFDVSHVPIRRSKLKNEADAFTTKKALNNPQNKEKGSNAFLFWLILLTGFILAIVINTKRGVISSVTKAITNENVLKLNHREEKKGANGHYLLLYFSFFINAAIFGYLVLYHFNGMNGWQVFQLMFLSILGIYLIRHLFLKLIGGSFPIQKEVSLYGFTIQSFNLFIGIMLIPMNLIIAFGPEKTAIPFIYISVIILGVLYLLRSFRGILISSRNISSNFFHFFLYLCAFEILPILLLIKVIENFNIA